MKPAALAQDPAAARPGRRPRTARAAASLAGPVLITVAVLAVLSDFALGGTVSIPHPDVLPYWLPTHCFLGKSLAAGHIPAWNPHSMAGAPFAADPQSGWMYVPAMLLYTALPCDAALRWFIVLQPILAGLGLYWFLRAERVSRPAATVGGLALSLPVAGSTIAVSLPFSGALAWSALTLAASARWLRAPAGSARVVWSVATAMAWGQIAAAHATNGLAVGSGALVFYLGAGLVREVREGRERAGAAALRPLALAVALGLVNLAFFVPRLAYLPRTSLGAGYSAVEGLAGQGSALFTSGNQPTWILRLALSPGLYLGAVALVLVPLALRAARHRHLLWAFAVFGALSYVLSLEIAAGATRTFLSDAPIGSFYLHRPDRVAFGVLLSLPVLAALGLEGWLTGRPSPARMALLVAPAALAWGFLPLLVGAGPGSLALAAVGATAGGLALAAAVRRPALAAVVPAVLAAELLANGFLGRAGWDRPGGPGSVGPLFPPAAVPVDLAAYLRPGPIARALQMRPGARYLSVDPTRWDPRGYHVFQEPEDWGLLGTHRAAGFGLEEAQGYNPVQPVRYWIFAREVDSRPMRFNVTDFRSPPDVVFDLLQVGWVSAPADDGPPDSGSAAAREGRWALYRIPDPAPRASVVTDWTAVGREQALALVADPAFDPARRMVLEQDPGLERGGLANEPGPGSAVASYRGLGPQAATVEVLAPAPAVVLIRNAWDPGWRATVDGRPSPVLVADYFLQGVAVPAGRHTILLQYDDPWIGRGFAGSGVGLAVLFGSALFLRRRRGRPPSPEDEGRSSGGARHTEDRPGHDAREGPTDQGQDQEAGDSRHGQRQGRDHPQGGGQVSDPEPPPRGQQAGDDQQQGQHAEGP